ncbi:hypothetical protein GCM10009734_11070 [Nonomuraea bangladeshensis]
MAACWGSIAAGTASSRAAIVDLKVFGQVGAPVVGMLTFLNGNEGGRCQAFRRLAVLE